MKKYVLVSSLVLVGIIALFINVNSAGNYIWKAYFYPGSNTALRGYPTISKPGNFTGTWIDYSYTGRILATQEYVDGVGHGKGEFFDDKGNVYFSRVLENGKWKSSGTSKGVPEKVVVPWFFPQRWANRSLDRLEIVDDIFGSKPAAEIGENAEDKSHNKRVN